MNLLNKIPHWLFVGLAMAAGAFVQSLQGDSNLFAEIFARNWTALGTDVKTGLVVGVAALIGYLKTDPWTTAVQKAAAAKKAPTVPPLAMLMLFGGLLGGGSLIATGIQGCTPAQSAELSQIEQIVLADVMAGKTSEQILEDVAAKVAKKPGIDVVIIAVDVLTLLVDTGVIPPQYLPKAQEHREHFKTVLAQRSASSGATK